MTFPTENLAAWQFSTAREVGPGVYEGDPYTYQDGVTAVSLRSGVDGPHAKLADELCSIRRDSL